MDLNNRRVLLVWLVLCVINSECNRDLCIGSSCTCTEYPIHIKCDKGDPNILPTMTKRLAITLELNGDSIKDVLPINLQEFVSLKSVDVNIYDPAICFWVLDMEKQFNRITFNVPKFCGYYKKSEININTMITTETWLDRSTDNPNDVPNKQDPVYTTYIQITPRDLLFLFIMFAFMSLCGIFRKHLR